MFAYADSRRFASHAMMPLPLIRLLPLRHLRYCLRHYFRFRHDAVSLMIRFIPYYSMMPR